MIISHSHRFVFVKTRKTAGTSVEIALSQYTGPDDVLTTFALPEDNELRRQRGADAQNQAVPLRCYGVREWTRFVQRRARVAYRSHMPATSIRRLTRSGLWHDYFTFTISRNSWDTAASAYYWQTRSAAAKPSPMDFLRSAQGTYDNWPMYTCDGEVIVDLVIRYDQLIEGLAEVSDRLGLPVLELPAAKSGLRRGSYRDLFGDSEREYIAEACRAEIEHFGWVF